MSVEINQMGMIVNQTHVVRGSVIPEGAIRILVVREIEIQMLVVQGTVIPGGIIRIPLIRTHLSRTIVNQRNLRKVQYSLSISFQYFLLKNSVNYKQIWSSFQNIHRTKHKPTFYLDDFIYVLFSLSKFTGGLLGGLLGGVGDILGGLGR